MKTLLKRIEENLFNNELISIHGCKTELGFRTKRKSFHFSQIKEICEWLRVDSKNSIEFIFEEEKINIK